MDLLVGECVNNLAAGITRDERPAQKKTRVEPPRDWESARDSLAEQMSDFACSTVLTRVADEVIGHTIEEHLLLDVVFESVLKSLLREPSRGTETVAHKAKTPLYATPTDLKHEQARSNVNYAHYVTPPAKLEPPIKLTSSVQASKPPK